jgi:acetyl-CoA acetyltransferase
MCKAKRGGLKDTLPDDILAPVLKAVVERTGVDPKDIGDIVVGSVLAPGAQRANECRMAAFFAGFPGRSWLDIVLGSRLFHNLSRYFYFLSALL